MSFAALQMRAQRGSGLAWTRPLSSVPLSASLQRLSGRFGSESAKLELKWMREEIRARRTADNAFVIRSSSCKRDNVEWELGELEKMVERRLGGEPLQYILGNQPFGPIAIKTRAPTLIPRPETEDWTIRLASLLEDRFPAKVGRKRRVLRMLDLCTGTGCIPILLSHLRRQMGGVTIAYGVDISTHAVSLARENATDHSLTPSSGLECLERRETVDPIGTNAVNDRHRSTLDVIHADILQEDFVQLVLSRTEPPFDVITSNPPYIPLDEYERLPNSVKEWEDRRALLGDPPTRRSEDTSPKGLGLAFYHRIAEIVSIDGVLGVNGVVALEVGHTQAEAVREILEEGGGASIMTEVWKDPWGVPRVVIGHKKRGRDIGPLV